MRGLIQIGSVWLAAILATGCGTTESDQFKAATPRPREVVLPLPSPGGAPWFETVAQTGIDFRHVSGDSSEKPFPAANGSGVAAFDLDLDGYEDVYFANGAPFPLQSESTEHSNRCYRNLGLWQFADVTAATRLGHLGYSAGLAVGDFDNDGFPDVFVNCFGASCLFHNEGDGTFRPVEAGVEDERWGTSAVFLDYDADGVLDLYVCNYAKWNWETNSFCGNRAKNVRHYCSPMNIEGDFDALYRGLGDGRFQESSRAAGLSERAWRAQGAVACDLNDDQHIDLYVGNDLHPNILYFNNGNGTFRDASEVSGAAYTRSGLCQASMGIEACDIDGDGKPELFVANFETEAVSLYRNLGNEQFQEVGQQRGLAAPSLPWIGWGTALADFNLDGWPDLVVVNGHFDDNRHLLGQDSPFEQPPLLWKNDRGRFEFLGASAGGYFAGMRSARGLALADFDNDGDQDLVVCHQDAEPALLENLIGLSSEREARFIDLRLVGTTCNRDAIGAKLILRTDDRVVVRQLNGGGSYLSAHSKRVCFAAPPERRVLKVEVRWPGGGRSEFNELQAGRSYVLLESSTEAIPIPPPLRAAEQEPRP